MMHAPRPAPILLTAALLGAASAAAQQPRPASGAPGADLFSDAISVDLVNVEVFVTDRSGEPVLDLGPGDFRVYEDGREVELTHFALIRPRPAGAGGRAPVSTESGEADEVSVQEPEPARIVVFLDLMHTGPASRLRLAPGLAGALEREMRPGDQVMVVTYDGSLDVVEPFTSEKGKIRKALQGLAPITGNQLQGQYADQRALEAVRLNQMVEANLESNARGSAGTCVAIGGLAEPYADQAYHHVQQTIDALTGFVDSLAGLRGRKVLLHVSDGIPLVPGGQVLSYAIELCDGTGAAQGIDYSTDTSTLLEKQRHRWDPFSAKQRLNELDTTRDWQRLAAHANVEQVSFYPVQAAGLGVTRLVDAATDIQMTGQTLTFGARNRQDTLDLIARETGGWATLNSNDVTLGVEAALTDSRIHYLLAFRPSATDPGSLHRIRVEVERPGARVRHRKSYRAKGVHEQVADGVLTALFYGVVDNPLEAALHAATSPGALGEGRRKVRLRVLVPLPRLTLLPRGERADGMVTVFLAVRDEEGNTTPVRKASIPLSVAPEEIARDYVYDVELDLGAGRHEVGVAVRDELGGATAYLRTEIPASRSGEGAS